MISEVIGDKKKYLDLLLLGDEQEDMIDRYLDRGRMFILEEPNLIGQCVVTEESEGIYEIKNISIYPEEQGKGFGKKLMQCVLDELRDGNTFYVGTGESELTVPFYESLGFEYSHRIENFFIDNYDEPIFEAGVQLVDMVFLKFVKDE